MHPKTWIARIEEYLPHTTGLMAAFVECMREAGVSEE
jgi:hypothetical protein